MAKGREPVDDLLDALIWMRRKAKKREPVDEIIAALMKMRREAKEKLEKRKVKKRVRSKSKQTARRSGRK
jgi:ClpP class serine protease